MSSSTFFKESWHAGPQSTQFYTRTYTPPAAPKAVVVFLHGFGEHIGRYTHFHPLFPEHGIAVLSFDQRGFGRTALDAEGHKSKSSAYGKTSWVEQMEDIAWAIGYAKGEFPGVPTFLMGHSMVSTLAFLQNTQLNASKGGAEALGFATQGEKSPYHLKIVSLAGVIATSPLILQTKPAPKLLRWVGGKASILVPHKLIPADVIPGVCEVTNNS